MNIIMGNKLLLFTSQLLFVSVFSAAVDNKLQINGKSTLHLLNLSDVVFLREEFS